MILTDRNVQSAFYTLVASSSLAAAVNGGVYREGTRPRSSSLEDITIAVEQGEGAQVQSGRVVIRTYVPDIDPYGTGQLVEDVARVEALGDVARQWASALSVVDNYLIRASHTITTASDDDARQHIIVVDLDYRYYDGD